MMRRCAVERKTAQLGGLSLDTQSATNLFLVRVTLSENEACGIAKRQGFSAVYYVI